jgi:hypothetical protein
MKNIHILPTDETSRLFKDAFSKYFISINIDQEQNHFKPQHLYITNDEEIKENDYVIVSCSEVNIEEVRIVTGYYNEQFLFDDKSQIHMDYCKKIILTTNEDLIKYRVQAIDDEFLEWFVKNPSCEEVEVESLNIGDGKLGYVICKPKEEPEQELHSMDDEVECNMCGNIMSLIENESIYACYNSECTRCYEEYEEELKQETLEEEELYKQDIIQLIEDRILSEYKKYSSSLPNEWAKIAAHKIYKSISDKKK